MLEIEPEYPQILTDLAEVTMEDCKTKFDMLWSKCSKFLSKNVGYTVYERGHTFVTNI